MGAYEEKDSCRQFISGDMKKKVSWKKLDNVFDQSKRIDRLENILIDLADAVQDDFVSGNEIITILQKHGVIKK